MVVTRKPRLTASRTLDGLIVTAFAADGKIVMIALTVNVDRKSQIFCWA